MAPARTDEKNQAVVENASMALEAGVAKARAKEAAAVAEREEAEWRYRVVIEHQPDPNHTVDQRVRAFLEKHPGKAFSPREIIVATRSGEESVRKVLVTFEEPTTDAIYVRMGRGEYGFCPHHGAVDHDSSKVFEGFYNVGDR